MFKAIFSSSNSSKPSKSDPPLPSAASKSKAPSLSSSPTMSSVPLLPSRGSSSAMSAWTVPPFPHPLPERRIGILPTEYGLLVYPRSSSYLQQQPQHRHHHSQAPRHVKASTTAAPNSSGSRPFGSGDGFKVATIGASNAAASSLSAAPLTATGALPPITSLDVGFLIDWSKDAKITPLQPSAWRNILDNASVDHPAIECCGIIGLSRFFSSSYLFVITSSKLIGHYFHDTRPIYCCTGVLAIPLLYDEASQAIRSQLAKQGGAATSASSPPSQPADSSIDDDADGDSSSSCESDSSESESESDYDDVETPAAIPKEPFFSSVSIAQRANTLRMPKSRPWLTRAARAVSDGRIETISEDSVTQSQIADASEASTDAIELPAAEPSPPSPMPDGTDPTTGTSPSAPIAANLTPDEQWHAAKQAELEDKAVRETAKFWARGEFWFSYDFDLTTSLQNKRRALKSTSKAESSQSLRAFSLPSHPAKASQTSSTDTQEPAAFPLLAEPYPNLPLWRRADRRFWHNEHMSKDLIHAGLHAYILPVMQGYLQTVHLPVHPVHEQGKGDSQSAAAKDADAMLRCQLMVISRRSKERAGLRYQRRGINESGQVANFVETEQILYVLRSSPSPKSTPGLVGDVLCFVQIRGSIPLYWSQSPFSLKPPPVLERTEGENTEACRKHFAVQVDRYGSVTCVNLAEQGGKEGCISRAYREAVEKLRFEDASNDSSGGKTWDRKKLHYVDFDFHKECTGMKFENVAKLIGQMEETLGDMQYYHHRTIEQGDAGNLDVVEVLNRQTGVFRVSCLDCLDRTNVVQSAFARHVLVSQLAELGIKVGESAAAAISTEKLPPPPADQDKVATSVAPPSAAQTPRERTESTSSTTGLSEKSSIAQARFVLAEKALDDAFNDIWANNANAISHCYSNTDALKVDFTRTGKRSFLGMINDATNSVYRMVQGAVTDFFRQTVLDFTYGSIGLHGLERYYDDLNSRDPSESIRLARVRASAIESCRREVVPETEDLVGGWTLCSPLQANTVQALKLEEKVVLLTAKALYICSYDFGSEKLNEYTKVLVGDIVGIQEGLYVTSPQESSHPDDNWGFVVTYLNSISRSNTTASIKNITTTTAAAETATSAHAAESARRIFAFRAISDEIDDPKDLSSANATLRSRHLHHTIRSDPSKTQRRNHTSAGSSHALDSDGEDDSAEGCISSKRKVATIIELLREACIDAGAFDADDEEEEKAFFTHKTIQSLDEAKAMMPLFGSLIEGLKRRLWL